MHLRFAFAPSIAEVAEASGIIARLVWADVADDQPLVSTSLPASLPEPSSVDTFRLDIHVPINLGGWAHE